MKTDLLSIKGEKIKEIELPKAFSVKLRKDVIQKVYESEKQIQAYSPDPMAGRKQSASGRIRHIRHKWRSAYGRGISRIPRKTMWRRGTQFYWIGAEISSTRGGRRAHPPRVDQFNAIKKINKKERELAFNSVISSTLNHNLIVERYNRIENVNNKKLPYVIESKLDNIKSKDLVSGIKKITGNLFEVSTKEKSVRAGKGKLRGRKYKVSQSLLIIQGNEEKIKTKIFEVKKVRELKIGDFYPLGRIVIYTEKAINDIENINLKKNKENKNDN